MLLCGVDGLLRREERAVVKLELRGERLDGGSSVNV